MNEREAIKVMVRALTPWTSDELDRIAAADELELADTPVRWHAARLR